MKTGHGYLCICVSLGMLVCNDIQSTGHPQRADALHRWQPSLVLLNSILEILISDNSTCCIPYKEVWGDDVGDSQ